MPLINSIGLLWNAKRNSKMQRHMNVGVKLKEISGKKIKSLDPCFMSSCVSQIVQIGSKFIFPVSQKYLICEIDILLYGF